MPVVRVPDVKLLAGVFRLMERRKTAAKMDDIRTLVENVLGEGESIGQHLAAATVLAALLHSRAGRKSGPESGRSAEARLYARRCLPYKVLRLVS